MYVPSRRTIAFAAASIGVTVLPAPVLGAHLSAARPAPATPLTSARLLSSPVTIQTSAGRKLTFGLTASIAFPPGGAPVASLNTELTTAPTLDLNTGARTTSSASMERHSWLLKLAASSISQTEKKGTFRFATGSQIQPLGQISLSFASKSSAAESCNSGGSGTVKTGTLTGTVHFNTLTTKWGIAGSLKKTLTFPSGSSVTFDHGCANVIAVPHVCQAGFEWFSPEAPVMRKGKHVGDLSFSGSSVTMAGQTHVGSVTADQRQFIASPGGGQRFDELTAITKSQIYNGTTHVLTVTPFTGSQSAFSGTVSIDRTGVKAQTYAGTCQGTKSVQSETTKYYGNLPWTNTAGHALTAKFVTGSGSVADDVSGSGITNFAYK
jgi:hypothetical protein